jgi:hypothetical protein
VMHRSNTDHPDRPTPFRALPSPRYRNTSATMGT